MEKITALVTGIGLLLAFHLPANPLLPPPPLATVCVDAGHGGDDPGAMSQDLTEATLNLQIAQKLKVLLEAHNYKVVMTRSDMTTNPTNSERAAICNENKADILLAIHLNASTDTTLDYTQGLYGTAEKDKKLTDSLHDTLLRKLTIADPPEDATTDFADNLLLKATMPATLQETVFISSQDEYTGLKNGTREDQIAEALYTGINDWFTKKENKT